MKNKLNLVIAGISLIVAIGILLYLVIYQFTHIDMTNARIFVNNWYWYLILMVCFILFNIFYIWKK